MNYWLISAVLGVFCLALLIGQTLFIPNDKIVFLDIGQGDAILLQSGTKQILVDGGGGNEVLQRLAEEMPWFDRTVDVVISTQPDKDHMGGLLQVVRRYNVGLVLLPNVAHDTHIYNSWLEELKRQLNEKKIAYRFVWRGDEMNMDNLRLRFLWPTKEIVEHLNGKSNNGSIVARVDMHGLSVLLTGDAEMPAEHLLVVGDVNNLLDVDVLKVGHHGSKTSTGQELLKAVTPGLAAISVGAHNRYGHPNPATLERLSAIKTLRTDQLGSIRLNYIKNDWLLSCAQKWCIKK